MPYICRPNLSTTSDMMPFREGRCFSMCEPDDLSHRDDKLMKPIGTIHILRNHLRGRELGVKNSKCSVFYYYNYNNIRGKRDKQFLLSFSTMIVMMERLGGWVSKMPENSLRNICMAL